MKKSLLMLVGIALLCDSQRMAIATTEHRFSGQMCIANANTSPYETNQNESGMTAGATTTDNRCPMTWETDPVDVEEARVWFSDGTTTDDISCFAQLSMSDGTMSLSSTRYSCATSGGCTSPSVSWTGSNDLKFTNPFGSFTNVMSLSIQCTIPLFSTIHHYNTTLVNP